MLSINKAIYVEDTFCYRDCVPSVKTATYVCNRFNFSFCARNHKKKQAISNLTNKSNQVLLWPISILKSLYNSISKLIYIDSYYVLFVIILTECDVFFLTSQKGCGIASVNYLKEIIMSPIETRLSLRGT